MTNYLNNNSSRSQTTVYLNNVKHEIGPMSGVVVDTSTLAEARKWCAKWSDLSIDNYLLTNTGQEKSETSTVILNELNQVIVSDNFPIKDKLHQLVDTLKIDYNETTKLVTITSNILQVKGNVVEEKIVEVIKEVEKIVEVPVEVIKEVEKIVEVPVEVIKEVEKIVEVPVESTKEKSDTNKKSTK